MEALATLAALLDRTINEVRTLENDVQLRVLEAVQKKEESLQAEHAQQVESLRKQVHEELIKRSQTEVASALETLKADFQSERDRLKKDFESERNRLNTELQSSSKSASDLQVEKSKLMAELQRTKDTANAEIDKVRSEAKGIAAAALTATQPAPLPKDEIARTEKKLSDLKSLIDDPATDLSVVIRKNVEKLELEAYLKGLQYATGRKP